MSDQGKTDHWAALASDLGTPPPADATMAANENSPATEQAGHEFDRPAPAARPAAHAKPAAAPRRPAPGNWDALAGELGVAGVEPPSPPAAAWKQSAHKHSDDRPAPARPAAKSMFEEQSHSRNPSANEAIAPSGMADALEDAAAERSDVGEESESVAGESTEGTDEHGAEKRPGRRRRKRRRGRSRDGEGESRPRENDGNTPIAGFTADEEPEARSERIFEDGDEGDMEFGDSREMSHSADEGAEGHEGAAVEGGEGEAGREERPRRRRRRRGSGRTRERVAGDTTAEDGPSKHREHDDEDGAAENRPESDAAHDTDDFDDEFHDDEEGEEGDSPRIGFRNIPTWDDAVGTLIAKNLESRAKNPGSDRSFGRNRGRGGGRGGRRRPPERK